MKKAEIPDNEQERLKELYDFDVLDTTAEKDFDEIVQLASTVCETPISLISLLDTDRQWFKAQVGLEPKETGRDIAFCAHTIHQEEVMVVQDASADSRFDDNPLVTGDPNIRFYAGMPLITSSGFKLGTLCVIDREPKTLTEAQKFCLKVLAKQVVKHLEFRRLNAKLQAALERNSIFVKQSPNALAMFDKEMRYMAASQKWQEDYKLTGHDIIGQSHYDIFPEIGAEWKALHQNCLNGATNTCEEARLERRDGSVQWITWDIRPWYITDGNIGGLLIYTADITKIKNKEKESKRIQEILDKTNEVARIGTWELDIQSGRTTWSKVTREIYEAEEDFTLHYSTAVHFYKEESQELIRKAVSEAVEYGTPYDLELELTTAKGNAIWVRSIGQADFERGKCVRLYGVFQDITESKRAKQAIIEAKNLAEQSADIKETFLANMSHEIRTPMNSIIGFTDLLLKRNLGADEKEYIQIVKNSGENLLRIINDILDISKINAGMMAFEEHPINIHDLLYSMRTMLLQLAKEKRLTLSFDADPKLPTTLLGDPTRLTQILLNLAGNAVKFTKEGSVTVLAKLIKEDADKCVVEFSVRDTGIGISENKVQQIFERFSQAEAHTTRKYGGTGLGLSIAKQLVELQGGSIHIRSKLGEGSLFTFILSFKKTKEEVAAANGKSRSSLDILNGAHLLVVDDNPINIKLIEGLLSGFKITYDVARDGKEALSAIKKGQYHLVLLDIEMPEMNGYHVTKVTRKELHNPVPIIAMTAHALPGEIEKCLRMGMNEYISKPIRAELLYEKMAQAIFDSKTNLSATPAAKAIDLKYLMESLAGKKELVIEVLDLFSSMVPADLSAISAAIAKGDYLSVQRRAHRLRSTALAVGANDMDALLKEVESLSVSDQNLPRMAALNEKLHALYRQVIVEVQHTKTTLSHNP